MHKTKGLSARNLALLGVLSALVFALTWPNIPVGTVSRLHLGNVMCLLSGMLFGPMMGGLASGIGSMLYDFTDPRFMPEFWVTFIMKFAMGFVAGWLLRALPEKLPTWLRVLLAGTGGQLLYIVLFLGKTALWQHFVAGNPWAAVWPAVGISAGSSVLNGAVAVAASVLLYPVLRAALQSAGVLPRHRAA